MSPTMLSGLEIRLDEHEMSDEVKDEIKFDQMKIIVTSIQKLIKKEVSPAADESVDVKIFLLDEKEKSFNCNVIKVIKDDVTYGTGESFHNAFSCDQCGFCTSQESYLESHKKYKIHGVGSIVCELCGTKFSRVQDLKIHQEKLHEDVSYQCPACDYEAGDSKAVQRHYRFNHGEKSIGCDLCNFTFATQRGLTKHKNRKHSDQPRHFKCDQCDYASLDSSNLKRHTDAKHQSAQYKCEICSYIGPTLRSLKRHMKKHEGNLFSCEKCEYTTWTHALLYSHGKESHCDAYQLLKCDECEYECPTRLRMKRHIREKHSVQEFKCDLCDYEGMSRSLLRGHKAIVHTIYICYICQKEERSRYLINKHVASHTGTIPGKSDEPSACDQCDFVGRNKRSLQYHQKKHEGKIYSCDKCDYTSPTVDQLRNHRNSKHGELKLKCDFCEFRFPANWRLRQHTERRHSVPKVKKTRRKHEKNDKGIELSKVKKFSHRDWKQEDQVCDQCSVVCGGRCSFQNHKEKVELEHALDHIVKTDDPVLYEVSISYVTGKITCDWQ